MCIYYMYSYIVRKAFTNVESITVIYNSLFNYLYCIFLYNFVACSCTLNV